MFDEGKDGQTHFKGLNDMYDSAFRMVKLNHVAFPNWLKSELFREIFATNLWK